MQPDTAPQGEGFADPLAGILKSTSTMQALLAAQSRSYRMNLCNVNPAVALTIACYWSGA
jgi:hypothetical protein